MSVYDVARKALATSRGELAAPAIVREPLKPPHPVDWMRRVSRRPLDPWQEEVGEWDGSDLLLCCTRQGGKTEIVSLRTAFRARWRNRSVGCLSPSMKQSLRMFNRAKRWLSNDGVIFSSRVVLDQNADPSQPIMARARSLELELPNGGRIEAFPGDRPDVSIRGDTLDDVIVDEASSIKDALIAAATPTMATRSDRCIAYLSTPRGQRGEFWRAWSQDDFWDRCEVTADQCPRIDRKFLERERKRLGPLFEQEYYCKFLAAPGALFAAADIEALFSAPPIEGFSGVAEPIENLW